mmetsp:Transcript_14194/g.20984  ORF Transcript_14194/g.20984 Transcript_14194/m.20984 type:complete len:214 (-) Transcript_14194:313-954(-)
MRTRLKTNIIDVGVRVIIPISTHSNIELSGKISPHRITPCTSDRVQTYEIVESIANFTCVHHFIVINSGQRISNHVTNAIERRLECSLVSCVQTINNIRCILEFHTTQLNVLTSGNVHNSLIRAVLLHAIGVETHLIRVDDTVGDLQSHHKLTRCALGSVQETDKFEAIVHVTFFNILPIQFSCTNLSSVLIHILPSTRSIFFKFEFLDRISL